MSLTRHRVVGAACLLAGALGLAALAHAQAPGDKPGIPPAAGEEAPLDAPKHWAQESAPRPGLGENRLALEAPREGADLRLAGAVDPATYRVGPGDVLQFQLWGKVSRTFVLEVGPEGVLVLPGAGTVRVDGRTLADVRADLLQRMGGQFRGVSMDLRLSRPRRFLVYLTGEVGSPGPVPAGGSNRVADVWLRGLPKESASLRNIEVLHRDGRREHADLDLFLRAGRQSANPYLYDGDVIQVPVATEFVHISGAVARPGRFELAPGDSVLTLLELAGHPIPASDADRALLVRWKDPFRPESLWLRLDDIYSRAHNPPLHDGDRFYVYYIPQYHLQHEATIVGEVARPGVYPIVEGRDRLKDLVRSAGGFSALADLSAIRVHRLNPAAVERDPELERMLRLSRNELTSSEYEVLRTRLAGLREDYRVDWPRLLREGPRADLLLRNGDVVRVDRLVASIRVDGEVQRPGILGFLPGQRVEDYVRQSGGYTSRAWRGKVRVTRSVSGQTLLARNVPTLGPGDFIWVPEKPDITVWEQTREVLTAVAQVATVVIAIRAIR